MFGPGYASDGKEWTQLPTMVRTDTARRHRSWIRNAGSTYESAHPATWNTAHSSAS